MDKIQLTGIRGYGYTGALPEEQVLGQWFEVDVCLGVDLSRPGQTDDLTDTLDYRQVIAMIQHQLTQSRFALLERLASAIAEAILSPAQPYGVLVQEVQVRLSKLAAPIPGFSGTITIELTRRAPAQAASPSPPNRNPIWPLP